MITTGVKYISLPWLVCSLYRFGNFIGRLPQAQLDRLLDLLFDADIGLGLNIVRYNIGGGFNARYSPQFNDTGLMMYRGMPGFKPQEGGAYDWGADGPQRAVLLGAKARGADKFIAFANSPPWWMTVSGDVAGAAKKTQCNLKASYFPPFAEYLTEVVRRYATDPNWNVTFDFLEPVNEPVEGFWKAGGAHEGCTYQPSDLERLLPLVSSALARKKLSTRLVGIDSFASATTNALPSMNSTVVSSLAQVHIHGYVITHTGSQDAYVEWAYKGVRKVAEQFSKEAWVTEWSPLQRAGGDIDIAIFMARTIIESVNIMRASAWVYWQAIDTTETYSLFNVRWNPANSYPHVLRKKYYTLLHFTTFATPGSVAIPPDSTACQHCITSFYNKMQRTLAVFVAHQQEASKQVQVSVKGFQVADSGSPSPVQVYRTSLGENMQSLGAVSEGFTSSLAFTALGRSLTTVVFTNVVKVA